jgi:zinc protease
MKTRILSILLLAFIGFQASAQIDRSQQPKPGPAPAISLGKPQTFTLPNGLKVMVVEDNKLPRVSVNLTIDNDPVAEGDKKGVAALTGALIGEGTTKTPKDKFNEEVDFMGASLSFSSSGAYAYGLSRYFERLVEMMSEGALMPNFNQTELDKQRDQMIEGLKADEKSASSISRRVASALAYGTSHPFGEYMTEESLKRVSLNDVRQHYNKFFVPQNAYLIVIGDVKFDDVKKQITKHFGKWKKAKAPSISYSDPSNVQFTQINMIDVPNAVQAEVIFMNTARLKMSDADYFPVLIANEILGGSFDSYLNYTLREVKAWTYGARSGIGASKNVTSFRASASLKMATVDSAVVEILNQVNRIRKEKVSDEDLANAKAAYVGSFVRNFAKPETVSRYALLTLTQNLPADFYEKYLAKINAVTKEDVMRVANKYFMADNARIIVAAKASEAAPKLEATGIPVLYFDKWGNRTEKPQPKAVSSDMSVNTVLNNFIKAAGGDKIKSVNSLSYSGSANVPGAPAPLSYTNKLAKGQMLLELSMSGMSIMKQVVNKDKGYMVQQGQRIELTDEMLGPYKTSANPFPEIYMLDNKDLTLAGIESFDGSDAIGIKNGDVISYYDTKTHLKVADVVSSPMGTQSTFYKDYREVKGVKVPFLTVMSVGMDIEIQMSDVKVNEGVSEEDFK